MGPPRKSFDQKKRAAQYEESSKLADSSALGALTKAAAIKAGRQKQPNAAHLFRKMETNPEQTASTYRQAEIASKKPRKYHFDYVSVASESNFFTIYKKSVSLIQSI